MFAIDRDQAAPEADSAALFLKVLRQTKQTQQPGSAALILQFHMTFGEGGAVSAPQTLQRHLVMLANRETWPTPGPVPA